MLHGKAKREARIGVAILTVFHVPQIVSGIQRQVTDEDLLKQIRDRLKTAMQTKDKLASTVFRVSIEHSSIWSRPTDLLCLHLPSPCFRSINTQQKPIRWPTRLLSLAN